MHKSGKKCKTKLISETKAWKLLAARFQALHLTGKENSYTLWGLCFGVSYLYDCDQINFDTYRSMLQKLKWERFFKKLLVGSFFWPTGHKFAKQRVVLALKFAKMTK